jgi:hypothetical protein
MLDAEVLVKAGKLLRVDRRSTDEIFNSKLVWRLVIRLYRCAASLVLCESVDCICTDCLELFTKFAAANPRRTFYYFDVTSRLESEIFPFFLTKALLRRTCNPSLRKPIRLSKLSHRYENSDPIITTNFNAAVSNTEAA